MAELKPYYLIHGSDRPKVRQALGRLQEHFTTETVEHFDASQATADDVVAACSMMGLLADRKLIIVQGAEEWGKGDVDAMIDYLGAPAETSVLALVANGLRSTSRMIKAATAGRGDVLKFEGPAKGQLSGWVQSAFQQRGLTVDAATARRLVERLGGDPTTSMLASEVDRLAAWAGTSSLSSSDIDELVELDVQMSIFSLVDGWVARDRHALLSQADRLVSYDRKEPAQLVSILASQIRKVHAARSLLDEMSAASAAQELAQTHGMKPYGAKKTVEQAGRITGNVAAAGLTRIALLEAELRGASALANRTESVATIFERGLAELV